MHNYWTGDLEYNANTGIYTYKGEVVSPNNLYVLNGEVGVFLLDGEIYTGSVFGQYNEILMTATDADGTYYSYWGAEVVDPNTSIGNMTISTLQEKFDVVQSNIEAVHEDNIARINLAQAETEEGQTSNGGTISLQTNGGADIPGSITVSSTGGTDGQDVAIEFSNSVQNSAGGTTTSSFTVDAGSKVVANDNSEGLSDGGELTSISINGVSYDLDTGSDVSYVAGNGITISGGNEIAVDIVDGSSLEITDGQLTAHDYRLVGAAVSTEEGGQYTTSYTGAYSVTDGSITLNVQDYTTGEIETVTIEGVASTDDVEAIEDTLAGAVMYDYEKEAYNYDSVTLGGEYGTPYEYNSNDPTNSGGTSITNLAYADVNGDGSAAVNVNLLKDYTASTEKYITNTSYTVDDNGTVTLTYTDGNGNVVSNMTATINGLVTASDVDAAKTEVAAGTNVASVTSSTDQNDGHTIYTVNANGTAVTSEDENFDITYSTDKETNVTTYDISLRDVVNIGSSELTTVTIDGTAGTIGGLTNTTWDGENYVSGQAATEDQLMTAIKSVTTTLDGAVMYDQDDGVRNYDSVTLGGEYGTPYDADEKTGGTSLTNVAYADTDGENYNGSAAVNVDLLKDTVTKAADAATTVVAEGKNISVSSTDETEDGHTVYTVSLEDDITLGGATGNGNRVYISGSNAVISLVGADGNGETHEVTIDAAAGAISGLTSVIEEEGWTTFISGASSHGDRAATEADLYELYRHSVNYDVDSGGNPDYTSITLRNAYDQDNHDGGTSITNVAYASGEDGSEAVNVDYLNDAVSTAATAAKTEVKDDGKNISVTSDEAEDGHTIYTVSLNDDLYLGGSQTEADSNITISGTNSYISISGSSSSGDPVTIVIDGNAGEITGLTNTTWTGATDDPSRAATEGQLGSAVSDAVDQVTSSEKHIASTGDNGYSGTYAVDKDSHTITMTEVNGNGEPTKNNVILEDVASAAELDVLEELVGDGDFSDTTYAGNKNEGGEYQETSVTDAIINLDGAISDLNGRIEDVAVTASQHSTVSAGNGITVTPSENENGSTNYEVSLADTFTVGDEAGDHVTVSGSTGTITATGNITAGSFTSGSVTINDGDSGLVSGLTNTTWDYTQDYSSSGNAATEAQLSQAISATVQYDRNDDGTVNKSSITLGGESGTTITNVAAGEVSATSTDAVNGSQLYATQVAVINNSQNIDYLSHAVSKLDNRIDRVGAGAAALAALHPLDFDPDAKWDFAAGYGNYRGANAVAVGAYYRPNEDVMVSIGSSYGGGENMVNAGVSFKIGAGHSNVTMSRTAMAKEIKAMKEVIANQDAQIQQLVAMMNSMMGISTANPADEMFPDVPENHWAYEAVRTLQKSGLAIGYPDGEFKGDRALTRYEFAQIVHKAVQAGMDVDARLVYEFAPELQYFRIDTVAQDREGNPTVQRVRANRDMMYRN